MKELALIGGCVEIILLYILSAMVTRYVFLEDQMKHKNQALFHAISVAALLVVRWFYGYDQAEGVLNILIAFNILGSRKKHRIYGLLYSIPICGISRGLYYPLVYLPMNMYSIAEETRVLTEIAANVILIFGLLAFLVHGKRWRARFQMDLKVRSLSMWETLLLWLVGFFDTIVIIFVTSPADNFISAFASDFGATSPTEVDKNMQAAVDYLVNAPDQAKSLLNVIVSLFYLVSGLLIFGVTVLSIIMVMRGNRKAFFHSKVSNMQFSIIVMMADIVENRDENTGGHIRRTAKYVEIITRKMRTMPQFEKRISKSYMEDMIIAAPLHDIGKIHVSDVILNKPGKLTDEEFSIMKTHASEGLELLSHAKSHLGEFSYLDVAIQMAGYHHEWWDGSAKGYPYHVSGEEIPLCARVMAVADVFDALTSKRIYKEPMPVDKALSIIREESGTHFDPEVVEAFFAAEDEIRRSLKIFLSIPLSTGHACEEKMIS